VSEKLIGTERLSNVIETVIWSGALANSIPISCLVVGQSGTGKSKTVLSFQAPSLFITNDMTSSGLFEAMLRDRENKIRHILFPDMNAILSHKGSTTDLFFGNMLALMSEGITRIDDGRQTKEIPHLPVGLIAAATPEMFDSQSKKWGMTGLKRRFLPLFFDYSTTTRQKVNEGIRNGHVTLKQIQKTKIDLPKRPATINIPEKESLEIESLSRLLAEHLSWHSQRVRDPETRRIFVRAVPGAAPMEFTPHLMLRALACANALKEKRGKINAADMAFLTDTIDFCRYGSPVQL
jgi:hypothetical protein